MNKPRLEQDNVMAIFSYFNFDWNMYPVAVAGIRGYYLDSQGVRGENDRALYDDALFIVTPMEYYPFNGNTDATKVRQGVGFGERKGIANIKANNVYYMWTLDYHKNKYLALCQRAGEVTVIRDGNPPYEQTSAYLGINCHSGGQISTGSEGCQTIIGDQFPEFMVTLIQEMNEHYGEIKTGLKDSLGRIIYNKIVVPYVIVDEKFRRLKIA